MIEILPVVETETIMNVVVGGEAPPSEIQVIQEVMKALGRVGVSEESIERIRDIVGDDKGILGL